MSDYKGSVALITGGNKGLGLEIARQLGKQGVRVVIGSRDGGNGEAAAGKLKKEGIDARAVTLDVTSAADIAALPGFFQKNYGRLDILVNNAGVNFDFAGDDPAGWQASTAATVSPDSLRKTFEANFIAPVAIAQALLPLLKASPAGRIVNHSSILGSLTLHGDPKSMIYNTKPLGYDASKAALNAFTVHLAYSLKDTKVKVNSAHPGWVKTDMGSQAAPMEIPDGAKTAVALATLPADGPTGGFFHMGERLPW
ncbi:MAG: short-chain dehydrogenase/reductase [Phycisphaerales bacterium]|nr:short-chain dehydrogenase/reductase [Phycisphaerales bacterium]